MRVQKALHILGLIGSLSTTLIMSTLTKSVAQSVDSEIPLANTETSQTEILGSALQQNQHADESGSVAESRPGSAPSLTLEPTFPGQKPYLALNQPPSNNPQITRVNDVKATGPIAARRPQEQQLATIPPNPIPRQPVSLDLSDQDSNHRRSPLPPAPSTLPSPLPPVSRDASQLKPVPLTLAFSKTELQTSLNVESSPRHLAQFPGQQEIFSAGSEPSLKTEPDDPDQKPFQPRRDVILRGGGSRFSPSITILTPNAYGKYLGQFSVGFGYQHRSRFSDEDDEAAGISLGLGDPKKWVGLDVNISFLAFASFDRGSVGFKVHRLLPEDVALAVGVNNAVNWGEVDGGISPFGVVTKAFILKDSTQDILSRLYITAGAGTGRYRSELDVFNDADTVGLFGSVALRLFEPMNFIAEWSGQDLSLGLSFLPFRNIPLVITPAVTDVSGNAGDGPRFIIGIGYGLPFRP